MSTVIELSCDHEEADTRMILHANHAAVADFKHVTIRSQDTDAAVPCLFQQRNIWAKLYLRMDKQGHERTLDISCIAEKIGQKKCDALVGLHAFTAATRQVHFMEKGKEALYHQLTDESFATGSSQLGHNLVVIDAVESLLERLVCKVYGTNEASLGHSKIPSVLHEL